MFLSCKNFCAAQEQQSELVVFETTIKSNLNQKKADKYSDMSQFEGISNIVYQKIVKSGYEKLVKELSGTGKNFTDPEFPPNAKSLGQYTDSRGRKAAWKRIPQINPKSVFFNSIDPNDIMQGNLGDCYFLSSIAALAEVPDRIRKMFGKTDINPNGFYMVHVNLNGICREVIVDDYFPVTEPLSTPIFAKPKDNEIWVMVLEKVWAKLRGSYHNISEGFPHEVLTTFTNAPCFYFEIMNTPYDLEIIWADLLEAEKENFAVCCGSKKKQQVQNGIVSSHTYTLLASYEVPIDVNKYRIVKIRNPWAFKEYQGQCSEYDKAFWSKVDPQTISHVGHGAEKQDGVFFMSYTYFIECFESIDIAHTKLGYSYNFESVYSESNQGVYFQVEIKAPKTECYFTLYQKNIGLGYGYGRCAIVIGRKVAKDSYIYIDSKMEMGFPTLTARCKDLEAGTYIVYCKCEWQDRGAHRLTLSTYSPSIVDIGITKKAIHAQFLEKAMFNHAFNNPNKQLLGSNNQWICMQVLYKQGGFAYIAASVQGNKKILFDFDPQDFIKAGFKVKGVMGKGGRCKVVVKQNEPIIILCKIQADASKQQHLVFPPNELKISQSI